ncbi:MAG: DUF4118 domain-containing protein [Chloroflexota bacterium]
MEVPFSLTPAWRRRVRVAAGPAATLAVLALLQILADRGAPVGNAIALYFALIVFSAGLGGIGAGAVSAVLCAAHGLAVFAIPYRVLRYAPQDGVAVALLILAAPLVAVVVGLLKQSRDQGLAEEARLADQLEQAEHRNARATQALIARGESVERARRELEEPLRRVLRYSELLLEPATRRLPADQRHEALGSLRDAAYELRVVADGVLEGTVVEPSTAPAADEAAAAQAGEVVVLDPTPSATRQARSDRKGGDGPGPGERRRHSSGEGGPASTRRLPVLLVGVSDEVAENAGQRLSRSGYSVQRPTQAGEALRLAREAKPFALLLSVEHLLDEGWTLLTALRRAPSTSGIPVLLVLAGGTAELGLVLSSTGYLSLPPDSGEVLNAVKHLDRQSWAAPSGPRVLVVDADETNRSRVRSTLVNAGCTVVTAENTRQALAMIGREQPAMIVLSLMSPGISAFDVACQLRQNPATADLPLLAGLSRDAGPEVRRRLVAQAGKALRTWPPATDDILAELLRIERRNPELAGIRDEEAGYSLAGNFLPHLDREIERAGRQHKPFSVLALGLDPDGPPGSTVPELLGNAVERLCNAFSRQVRSKDLVVREHSAEVMVLLPETDAPGAEVVLGKLGEVARGFCKPAVNGVGTLRLRTGHASYPAEAESGLALLSLARQRAA